MIQNSTLHRMLVELTQRVQDLEPKPAEPKLMTCPFCQSTSVHLKSDESSWWALCISCGADGPDGTDKTIAAEKWNQRAAT